jgi:P-type Mg2+ transporter
VTITAGAEPLDLTASSVLPVAEVLAGLHSSRAGLSTVDAEARLAEVGPNAVREHSARAWGVLRRQVQSPLLGLLAVTAVASGFLGERTDAVIIGVILAASVGLGW